VGSAVGLQALGLAVGDMDGDGLAEKVSLRRDERRPLRCRYLLVVRQGARVRTRIIAVAQPDGNEPRLIGLAGIARGRGLEAIVDSNCCGAYVTGQWLFRETRSGLPQMHVRQFMTEIPDTFPNGASLCCGDTPVCGSHPGTVLVFGEGRYATAIDEAHVLVQHGDTFLYTGRRRLRRPGRREDFQNCRPWIAAHGWR
jgi:hypothetical protein